MGTTQLAICNTALERVRSQDLLTGGAWPAFVGTPSVAGAANVIYGPMRDLLLRQINPEFSRITVLATILAAPPPVPWSYAYQYPADAVRIRTVRPPGSGVGALADPNDPVPIRKAVAYVGAVKAVLTNQQNALLVYSSNAPSEALWDGDFAEAMEMRLASIFAMAIAGRPDFARELIEESERYAGLAAENGDF